MLTMAWCFHDNDNPGTFHPSFTMVLDMGGARCTEYLPWDAWLAGWLLTLATLTGQWSLCQLSRLVRLAAGPQLTDQDERRRARSDVSGLRDSVCRAVRRVRPVMATGLQVTPPPPPSSLSSSLRLSVSHGGSRDQASLDTAGHRRKVSF